MIRLLQVSAALACLCGGGLLLLERELPGRPTSLSRALRLLGPARALPMPFLWSAWGRANRSQDPWRAMTLARTMIRFLPEREYFYTSFAYDLAYELGALEADPGGRTERLLDALRLLEEGMAFLPREESLPLLAYFLVQDLCLDRDLSPTFRKRTGVDPHKRAQAYLSRAGEVKRLEGGPRFMMLHLAVELMAIGDRESTARILGSASAQWPEHAERLAELARILESGEEPSPGLCAWLKTTDPFRRKTGIWGCK